MKLRDKLLNKHSSWIAGLCLSASCFYGAATLDNRLVDEKSIYAVVPEVERVLYLGERLGDFKECANIVENSNRLSTQLGEYSREYEDLMEKPEVKDARIQIAKNKKIERNSFLLTMGGIYSFILGFGLPYFFKIEKDRT